MVVRTRDMQKPVTIFSRKNAAPAAALSKPADELNSRETAYMTVNAEKIKNRIFKSLLREQEKGKKTFSNNFFITNNSTAFKNKCKFSQNNKSRKL